jgi:rhodanese-related sulfurtransferase
MRMGELDKDAEIIVQCHHGSRSWNVAAYLMQNGFTNVKNLTGGIDAWARRIDRGMRTY